MFSGGRRTEKCSDELIIPALPRRYDICCLLREIVISYPLTFTVESQEDEIINSFVHRNFVTGNKNVRK